ncbi:MAG: sigma-70 family RNA polymerase sigma factor [Bacteroidota bacterium]|nr:sigma-70 family RNA polymerase sigma factor [Bacteroidota bacterium]
MSTSPDNELVLRLLTDDVEAFDALYNRYSHSLYANIFKLTKNEEAARDILQDVFVVLWEKRFTINVNQPVSNWLFAISYYQSLSYLKKKLREQLLRKAMEDDHFTYSEREADRKENSVEVIKNAIQQLSPQKQKVLIRCKLNGKTYKEVADELSISRHTVKEYLSLAITSLRTILK